MLEISNKYKGFINEDFQDLMSQHTSKIMSKSTKDVEDQLKRFGCCDESDEVQVVQEKGSWVYYYKKILICILRFTAEGYELKVHPEGTEDNFKAWRK